RAGAADDCRSHRYRCGYGGFQRRGADRGSGRPLRALPACSMSEALLKLEEMHVRFASQNVLEGARLEVNRGEIVTLIGPNGAGKTTLVRVVLGLLKPDRGDVWRQPKLRIGYMPQKLHVDATLPLSVLRFLRLVPGVARERALAAL